MLSSKGTIEVPIDAWVDSGTLYIVGRGDHNDRVEVTEFNGLSVNLLDWNVHLEFNVQPVYEIRFFGGAGNDEFYNITPLPSKAYGGPGDEGAGQGSLGRGTGFAEAPLALGAAIPEGFQRGRVTELVATELQLRLPTLSPEFLRAFHTTVDLFDLRLTQSGGDRQALATVLVVPHPRRIVAQIPVALAQGFSAIRVFRLRDQALQFR
jgi:hypothetical protein